MPCQLRTLAIINLHKFLDYLGNARPYWERYWMGFQLPSLLFGIQRFPSLKLIAT